MLKAISMAIFLAIPVSYAVDSDFNCFLEITNLFIHGDSPRSGLMRSLIQNEFMRKTLGFSELSRKINGMRQARQNFYPDLPVESAVLKYLDIKVSWDEQQVAGIPKEGKLIVVGNHPIGARDGFVNHHTLSAGAGRKDVIILGNDLIPLILPEYHNIVAIDIISPRSAGVLKKNREVVEKIVDFVNKGGVLLAYPAGVMGQLGSSSKVSALEAFRDAQVIDQRWKRTIVEIIHKTQAPIVPMHNQGRLGMMSYALGPLKLLLNMREMLWSSGKEVHVRVGAPIPAEKFPPLLETDTFEATLKTDSRFEKGAEATMNEIDEYISKIQAQRTLLEAKIHEMRTLGPAKSKEEIEARRKIEEKLSETEEEYFLAAGRRRQLESALLDLGAQAATSSKLARKMLEDNQAQQLREIVQLTGGSLPTERNAKVWRAKRLQKQAQRVASFEKIIDQPTGLLPEFERLVAERKLNLLTESGHFAVYYSESGLDIKGPVLDEIGRLREITFREAGEGSGLKVDIDKFDDYYGQFIIVNKSDGDIVGGYRLGMVSKIIDELGIESVYSQQFFGQKKEFFESLGGKTFEAGRSFVKKEFQNSNALNMVWNAIAKFTQLHPEYVNFIGPVSISDNYSELSKKLMIDFARKYLMIPNYLELEEHLVNRHPYVGSIINESMMSLEALEKVGLIETTNISGQPGVLKKALDQLSRVVVMIEEAEGHQSAGIPSLFKYYSNMLGGRFIDFSIDEEFNTVDGLIIIKFNEIPLPLLSRFLGNRDEAKELVEYQNRMID